MNEIPKNSAGSSRPQQPQKIEQVKSQELNPEISSQVPQNITQETKDLPSVDAAGRSLVSADNLENDIKFLQENPKAVAFAMDYFDRAYASLKEAGHENPYEEASKKMHTCAKF